MADQHDTKKGADRARAEGQALVPELVEPEADPYSRGPSGPAGGLPGAPFGGRAFGGGRVRVYGCSPGCLIASLLIALVITLLINAIL